MVVNYEENGAEDDNGGGDDSIGDDNDDEMENKALCFYTKSLKNVKKLKNKKIFWNLHMFRK